MSLARATAPRAPGLSRPLKVVNVVTHFGVGGAQETIVQAAELLDPDRVQLSVLAGSVPDPDAELVRRTAAAGVTIDFLASLGRPIRPVNDGRALRELTRRWAASPPDIIHTHSSKAGVVGRVAAVRAKVPSIVHTVHGWSAHPGMPIGLSYPVTWIERCLAGRTDRLILVSQADRDWAARRRIGREDTYRVVRSGVPLARFARQPGRRQSARASLGLAPGAPVVGSVMRLCPQKDPTCLLQAFATALHTVPDAHLVIVGDGPSEAEVRRQISRLGLVGSVCLAGNRSEVPELLAAFDAFALSSAWEGLPRVAIEAVAAGVPIVATRVGGLSEVVEDGLTGLLVAPHDPTSLGEAMVALLTDRGRAARMAEAGLGAIASFDAALMARDLTSVYEELASRRTSCASST